MVLKERHCGETGWGGGKKQVGDRALSDFVGGERGPGGEGLWGEQHGREENTIV